MRLVNGRKWEHLDEIETGQLGGLYEEQFGKIGTDEQIRNWLKL
jgi:hypothetical protein